MLLKGLLGGIISSNELKKSGGLISSPLRDAPIKIGKNARIGTHSTIMPGVEIGENAIIGAHSFVKNNVPANITVFGVPAK